MNSRHILPDWRKRFIAAPVLAWALFLGGVSLQFFSPHLQVAHDSFVIPDRIVRQGAAIDPRALVRRERSIQFCSAALVLLGAIGLGRRYRHTLLSDLFHKGAAQ